MVETAWPNAILGMKLAMLTIDNREHYHTYDLPCPWFGTAPQALLQGFELYGDLEVHVISCTRRPMNSPAMLAENIFFHSLHVPKIGWLRTGYQGCIRAVRRKLNEIKPDIVHGHGTEMDCAMEAIFSGFPNVLTLHGNMREMAHVLGAKPGSFHWFAARLEHLALKKTKGVVCNSRHTLALAQPLSKRTWHVPNALRREFFGEPTAQQGPSHPIKFLQIGTIDENKQQLEVLKLARNLHARHSGTTFAFVGAVPAKTGYSTEFLKQVREPELSGFAQHITGLEVPKLIKLMDESSALIHGSRSESFGLVVAEALSRNLKVFAMRIGGVSDIAENVDGAELFEPGNWSNMKNAISAWLSAGAIKPQAAGSIMAKRYHPKVIASQHLTLYQEVLDAA